VVSPSATARVSVAAPLLVKVTIWAELVWPTVTLPKARAFVESVAWGAGIGVPVADPPPPPLPQPAARIERVRAPGRRFLRDDMKVWRNPSY
jgi:hypothetical protein